MKTTPIIITLILQIIFLGIKTSSSYGQSQLQKQNQEITALAKLVSYEGGDKIHLSRFSIIKKISDTTFLGDTITVGYYLSNNNDQNFDTVLLTLNNYNGDTKIKNFFICPNYDVKIGIQKARINFIDFNYWENCETGKSDCKPLTFTRRKQEKNWFLIMPCGGTATSITVSNTDNSFRKQLHFFHNSCPPFIELTNLADGKYMAYMTACGLGGLVRFNLITY